MKLYTVDGSNNCARTLATKAELGLDFEVVKLNFMAGDLKKPEYLAINPTGRVPALVDGSFSLWESNAIMQYLCSKKPGNKLYPEDPQVRADITRWQCWELAHFGSAAATLTFENMLKPMMMKQEPNKALVEHAMACFHREAKVLEAQLAKRDFILGKDYTLADFSVAANLMYAEPGRVPVRDYPTIAAWQARVMALPCWKDVPVMKL